ncbi:MAG TPA: flagellar basal body P-ring formation chaperone FlgA [Candidatus Binataceae bacterium]|nr:flagellar basal body P-ring formation chaperone FlgA [Candidatus Binataceae bacterium]
MASSAFKFAVAAALAISLIAPAEADADTVTPVAAVLAAQPAASSAHPGASAPTTAAPPLPDLNAALVARVTPLMPPGVTLQAVTLGCDPPAGATLADVAPGMTQLQSRSLTVVLTHDGATTACTAIVAAQRQVLVAARDIAAGEAVATSDFQAQAVEAFSAAPNALEQLPRTSMVAANPIRAGQPLYAYQLIRPLAIHPGDLVIVTISNGPVTVRAQLQSNSAASVGDTATVINPESGAPVGVTVTGVKTAELVMP